MLRVNEKTIFSLILVAFAIVLLVEASGLRARAAMLPNLIGYPLLIGSLVLLIGDLFPAIERKFKRLLFSGVNTMDGAAEGEEDNLKGMYGMILWMLLFLGLIYFAGVIAGIFIAMVIYLKLLAKSSWLMSVVYPLLFTAFVYLVFVVAMDVYYFTSPVMEW